MMSHVKLMKLLEKIFIVKQADKTLSNRKVRVLNYNLWNPLTWIFAFGLFLLLFIMGILIEFDENLFFVRETLTQDVFDEKE